MPFTHLTLQKCIITELCMESLQNLSWLTAITLKLITRCINNGHSYLLFTHCENKKQMTLEKTRSTAHV